MSGLTGAPAAVRQGLLFLLLVLGGCAPLDHHRTTVPPLPAPDTLACCQQLQERITLSRSGKERTLQAAVAIERDRVVVVVMDPLGRRVLTLRQTATGVTTESRIPRWDKTLSHWLLAALYLHHLDFDEDDPAWPAPAPDWSVSVDTGERVLHHRAEPRLRLQYPAAASPTRRRHIAVVGGEFTLTIDTVQRETL